MKNTTHAPAPVAAARLFNHSGQCRCTPDQILRYRGRISGPLLDRIDLHVEVPSLGQADLEDAPRGESSRAVRERVVRAREIQLHRQGMPNAQLAGHEIEERGKLKPDARRLLHDAISRLGLSGRAYHRVLKVARTGADLEPSTHVGAGHVAEALQYRGIARSST